MTMHKIVCVRVFVPRKRCSNRDDRIIAYKLQWESLVKIPLFHPSLSSLSFMCVLDSCTRLWTPIIFNKNWMAPPWHRRLEFSNTTAPVLIIRSIWDMITIGRKKRKNACSEKSYGKIEFLGILFIQYGNRARNTNKTFEKSNKIENKNIHKHTQHTTHILISNNDPH